MFERTKVDALRNDRETLKAVLDGVDEAIYVADPETDEILYANEAFEREWGKELLGKKCHNVLQNRSSSNDFCANDRIFGERLGKTHVWEFQSKVTTRWYQCTAKAIRWTNGKWVRFELVRDVTERKRAEESLVTSERRFRTMVETVPLAIHVGVGIEQKTEYLNPTMVKLFGYTLEDMPSAAEWWPLAYPDPAYQKEISEEWTSRVKRAAETNSPIEPMEVVVTCRDGSKKNISWGFMTLGDKNYSYGYDLTERKKAEENYRTLFNEMLDGFAVHEVICDGEGRPIDYRFLAVNPAFERMTGLRAHIVVGRTALEVLPAAWHKIETFGRVALTGEPVFFETATADSTRHFEVTAFRPRPKQFACILSDITERKKLQAGLAQSDRLASMGMLAAGIAHEINNPLAYVLANTDMLAMDLPRLAAVTERCCAALKSQIGEEAFAQIAGDDIRLLDNAGLDGLVTCARSALEGTLRSREISRSLSTFSRVESAERRSVDLNLAIEHAATMAHNELRFRATLIKELGRVPAVLATLGKLSQVFLNLLINAAHAIGEGHVDDNHITVRTWAEGSDVFAEVEDTGQGIAQENLERIFEPFFSTKKLGTGSGLGLSISKNIVTEFGGDIRVESEVGKGTRFVVRLPAHAAAPEEQLTEAVTEPPGPAVRGRVLIVDDELHIREFLQRMLQQQHEVVTAASGRECQLLLETDTAFDVILCDLMMPEVSGMELHAWIASRNPELAHRVVFISGGAFTDNAASYLERVDNLRIEKPFDRAPLKKLVHQLVAAVRAGI